MHIDVYSALAYGRAILRKYLHLLSHFLILLTITASFYEYFCLGDKLLIIYKVQMTQQDDGSDRYSSFFLFAESVVWRFARNSRLCPPVSQHFTNETR